jgi:hypothetical protein
MPTNNIPGVKIVSCLNIGTIRGTGDVGGIMALSTGYTVNILQ